MEARRRTKAGASTQRQHRTAPETAATRYEVPTGFSERTCPIVAGRSLEAGDLEARSETETAVMLWRFAAPRTSRLLAFGTASRRMVADGMANRRIRTDQVLAMPADIPL